MSKVPGSKILEDCIVKKLPPELFVTVTMDGTDGEDSYRDTHESKEDAVDAGDHNGELVATYKLVRLEELKLVRSTQLVPT